MCKRLLPGPYKESLGWPLWGDDPGDSEELEEKGCKSEEGLVGVVAGVGTHCTVYEGHFRACCVMKSYR